MTGAAQEHAGAPPSPAPSVATSKASAAAAAAKAKKMGGALRAFLEVDQPEADRFSHVKDERQRFKASLQKVKMRSLIILALVGANILLQPFLRPTYHYSAMTPDKKTMPLMGLFEANQTDQAILSWAATGITEIMTLGFGDFDSRLLAQRKRFTQDGWQSFVEALMRQDLRQGFKMRQLVLTTVPTDAPVIVSKGIYEDKKKGEPPIYRWIVEMPIIMTYQTNNNVSSARRGIVRLTIVRVPSSENISGIGIKTWQII